MLQGRHCRSGWVAKGYARRDGCVGLGRAGKGNTVRGRVLGRIGAFGRGMPAKVSAWCWGCRAKGREQARVKGGGKGGSAAAVDAWC